MSDEVRCNGCGLMYVDHEEDYCCRAFPTRHFAVDNGPCVDVDARREWLLAQLSDADREALEVGREVMAMPRYGSLALMTNGWRVYGTPKPTKSYPTALEALRAAKAGE